MDKKRWAIFIGGASVWILTTIKSKAEPDALGTLSKAIHDKNNETLITFSVIVILIIYTIVKPAKKDKNF